MTIIGRRGAAIISMIVIVLALAVAIPPFIDATGEDSSKTFTQTEGEDLQLTGTLFADLTTVRDGQSFTEVDSIHTTDTDFNGANTLDNVSVTGTGDDANVEYPDGPIEGTTATRSGDNDASTTSLSYGVKVTANDGLSGVKVTVSDNVGSTGDLPTRARLYLDDGTLLETETGTFEPGDVIIFDHDLSSGLSYRIELDNSGNDHGIGFFDGTSTDSSSDIDIDGGSAEQGTTSLTANIISVTALKGDPDHGTYIGEVHSVNGAETGFTNISLTNAEATVTWLADTDGDGSFETTVSEDTRTSTGNYTVDLSETSGQNWRVNVTFIGTGSDPTGELHDEGITSTTTEGTDVNVTLVDTETGQTVGTGPINESETRQFTIGGEVITVTNEDVLSSNRSLITYDYPTYYGMGGGVKAIMSNAPLIALALGFIIVVMGLYAGRGV